MNMEEVKTSKLLQVSQYSRKPKMQLAALVQFTDYNPFQMIKEPDGKNNASQILEKYAHESIESISQNYHHSLNQRRTK